MKSKPILLSDPIPNLTFLMSAPVTSQIFATSFMNEIFVASIAFATYLVISELFISINTNLS